MADRLVLGLHHSPAAYWPYLIFLIEDKLQNDHVHEERYGLELKLTCDQVK